MRVLFNFILLALLTMWSITFIFPVFAADAAAPAADNAAATAAPATETAASAAAEKAAAPAAPTLGMTTTAFLDEGILPVLYTCDGKDLSPQFSWTDAPAKTESFVLIASDPDSPNGVFYHWVVYNIPKTVTELPEGAQTLPAGTLVGKNSYGKQQYNGPCPPKGTAHTYAYTLYAVGKKLSLPAGADAATVLAEIKSNTLAQITLTTVYSRWIT